VRKVIFQKTFF